MANADNHARLGFLIQLLDYKYNLDPENPRSGRLIKDESIPDLPSSEETSLQVPPVQPGADDQTIHISRDLIMLRCLGLGSLFILGMILARRPPRISLE